MSDISIVNEDKRYVAGWASVEIVDTQGDVVPVSELSKAFLNLMDRGGHIIYGHKNYPVGKIMQWEVKEHPVSKAMGVYMIVKINTGYEADDMVWNLIKQGKLAGFSIGGKGRAEKTYIEKNGVRAEVKILKNIQLNEVSVVDIPANPLAKIEQIAMIAKCAKCGSDVEEHAVEKTDGAVSSGDSGVQNERFGGVSQRPKKIDDKDDEEEDEKDEDKKKGLNSIMIEGKPLSEHLEAFIKDHIQRYLNAGMAVTQSDIHQDQRKDRENEVFSNKINELDAHANPNSKATICSCGIVATKAIRKMDDAVAKIKSLEEEVKKNKLERSFANLSLNTERLRT